MGRLSDWRGVHLTVGEAKGYVILSIPGWPDAWIDSETAREIVEHMTRALAAITEQERRERDGS